MPFFLQPANKTIKNANTISRWYGIKFPSSRTVARKEPSIGEAWPKGKAAHIGPNKDENRIRARGHTACHSTFSLLTVASCNRRVQNHTFWQKIMEACRKNGPLQPGKQVQSNQIKIAWKRREKGRK